MTAPQKPRPEGWTYLLNSFKRHYFRNGQSFCGRWQDLSYYSLNLYDDQHEDNCLLCRRKRKAEQEEKLIP